MASMRESDDSNWDSISVNSVCESVADDSIVEYLIDAEDIDADIVPNCDPISDLLSFIGNESNAESNRNTFGLNPIELELNLASIEGSLDSDQLNNAFDIIDDNLNELTINSLIKENNRLFNTTKSTVDSIDNNCNNINNNSMINSLTKNSRPKSRKRSSKPERKSGKQLRYLLKKFGYNSSLIRPKIANKTEIISDIQTRSKNQKICDKSPETIDTIDSNIEKSLSKVAEIAQKVDSILTTVIKPKRKVNNNVKSVEKSPETDPKVIESSETDPKVIESSETDPKVIESSETDPKVIESSETDPKVIESSETDPKVIESFETDPKVAESPEIDPKVTECPEIDPKDVESSGTDPKVAESLEIDPKVTECRQLVDQNPETIDNNTELSNRMQTNGKQTVNSNPKPVILKAIKVLANNCNFRSNFNQKLIEKFGPNLSLCNYFNTIKNTTNLALNRELFNTYFNPIVVLREIDANLLQKLLFVNNNRILKQKSTQIQNSKQISAKIIQNNNYHKSDESNTRKAIEKCVKSGKTSEKGGKVLLIRGKSSEKSGNVSVKRGKCVENSGKSLLINKKSAKTMNNKCLTTCVEKLSQKSVEKVVNNVEPNRTEKLSQKSVEKVVNNVEPNRTEKLSQKSVEKVVNNVEPNRTETVLIENNTKTGKQTTSRVDKRRNPLNCNDCQNEIKYNSRKRLKSRQLSRYVNRIFDKNQMKAPDVLGKYLVDNQSVKIVITNRWSTTSGVKVGPLVYH